MQISQIHVVVRGTNGEAAKVVLDSRGGVVSGDANLLPLVKRTLGATTSTTPAGPPEPDATRMAALESENEVIDAQPSENEVIDAQPSENEV